MWLSRLGFAWDFESRFAPPLLPHSREDGKSKTRRNGLCSFFGSSWFDGRAFGSRLRSRSCLPTILAPNHAIGDCPCV